MELNLQRDVGSPLYLRLTSELRRQMESGALKPGDRLPSFAELRSTYGIHKNTIERAHLLLEQEGLVIREQGRGTFVSQQPRRKSATHLKGAIGFCGASFLLSHSSPYWLRLLEGVWAALAPDGQQQDNQLLLFEHCQQDVAEKADGILINASWRSVAPSDIPQGLPAVSLISPNRSPQVSSVAADDYAGAREATQHLLDLGHRRIAYLCSGTDVELAPRRLAGYRDALQGENLLPNPRWVRQWKDTPRVGLTGIGQETMVRWLQDDWQELGCTAVLTQNDEAARGVIAALEASGLSVPEDVSVVGFDGTEPPDDSRPSLTTVEVPLRQIGQRGVELLLKQIHYATSDAGHVTLPTTFRAGETTAAPKSS